MKTKRNGSFIKLLGHILKKSTWLWLVLAFLCSGCGFSDLILPAEDITIEVLAEEIARGDGERWEYEWVRFKAKVNKAFDHEIYLETGRDDVFFMIFDDVHEPDDSFKKYKAGKTHRFRVQISNVDPSTSDDDPYKWYIIAWYN